MEARDGPLLDQVVIGQIGGIAVTAGWVSFFSILVRFFLTTAAAASAAGWVRAGSSETTGKTRPNRIGVSSYSFWGFKRDDHTWKPAAQLIRTLVESASKNANYLLNIGPDAQGFFRLGASN